MSERGAVAVEVGSDLVRKVSRKAASASGDVFWCGSMNLMYSSKLFSFRLSIVWTPVDWAITSAVALAGKIGGVVREPLQAACSTMVTIVAKVDL
jgi:hypothetical protein